ncbi:quinoprotein relay system zinc metallohydrolase 1 [uncultured Paracoccus sp.]|uniref:quinoprotein relay system zinc metallohydrolase 1 n=1 Tax=uncultured Paracoccus sp. TaxID=189685 RepID=UPI0025D5A81F|nr:quinoprotein relay system zinc metallohydrolase 1 [uncultured Paracoccus sp.]
MILTRRQTLLGATTAALLPAALTPSPAQAAPDYRLTPRQVADGVWLIEGDRDSITRANGGAICNIAMLETPEGAVVVDTGGTARHGAALRGFADQRLGGVAAALNTHHHPDHWFGNQAFADRPIHALPGTIAAQAAGAQALSDGLYRILGSWMQGTAPQPAMVRAGGDLVIGGRGLTVMALSGHSQADLALIDQRTGTLIAGDLLFLDRAPSFPDADIAAWRAALATLAVLPVSGTIPGHGPFHQDSRAAAQTLAYLDAFAARLDQAAAQGLTPVEALAAGPMPAFARLGANPAEYRRATVQQWRQPEISALPLIGGSV